MMRYHKEVAEWGGGGGMGAEWREGVGGACAGEW